jgi:hypothetical protein
MVDRSSVLFYSFVNSPPALWAITGLALRILDLDQSELVAAHKKRLLLPSQLDSATPSGPAPSFPKLRRAAVNNYGGSRGRRRGLSGGVTLLMRAKETDTHRVVSDLLRA